MFGTNHVEVLVSSCCILVLRWPGLMGTLSVAAILAGRPVTPMTSPRAGPDWQEEADRKFTTVSWSLSLPLTIKTIWGFPGGSVVKNLPASSGHAGLIPNLGRSPWRRKWQPTPVSLREIPWTGGASRVRGAAKSQTWLSKETTKTVKTKWDKPKKATWAVPTSHFEILVPLCRETTNKTTAKRGYLELPLPVTCAEDCWIHLI